MPSTEDNSDTKERLLEIAFDILEKEGASALKVRAMAERAGLSISVVNHHFGSKQGLLDACKNSYYQGLAEVVTAVIAETKGEPLETLVEAAIRDTFSYSRVHRGVLRMLTSDMFADGELIEAYQGVGNRPHFNPVMDQFAPGLGLDPKVARVRLQAVSVVLTRFSTSSDPELEAIFGVSGDEAVAAAEEHMVQIANLLLCSKR